MQRSASQPSETRRLWRGSWRRRDAYGKSAGFGTLAPWPLSELLAEQETKLLDAEFGAGQEWGPAPGVGGLDEGLLHVQGGALDAVAQNVP